MPDTHDWGRFYTHTQRYPKRTPYALLQRASTSEQEDPYRKGLGLVLRAPLTRSVLVVGLWGPPPPPVLEDEESAAILSALDGRSLPITLAEIRTWVWAEHEEHGWRVWLRAFVERMRDRSWLRARKSREFDPLAPFDADDDDVMDLMDTYEASR
jgi:hypothetical protein